MRTCWKTKNFDPNDNPTILDSSTDESNEEVKLEYQDSMMSSPASPLKVKKTLKE